MHNYLVFLRKESLELLRTKRLLGLGSVFLFFALTSPLLARYMVEFIAALVPAEEALTFLVPDPVWTDSYTQFYGNIAQIGIIAMILLFMGTITSEKGRGTADLVLTKGLGYGSFVLSKFTVISATALLTMKVSIGVVYFYTYMLFDTAGNMGDVFLGAAIYALFLLMIVALILFVSALARSSMMAALLAFIGYLVISTMSALPRIGDLLPGNLPIRSLEITVGEFHADLWGNIGSALALTVLFLVFAVFVLQKRERE